MPAEYCQPAYEERRRASDLEVRTLLPPSASGTCGNRADQVTLSGWWGPPRPSRLHEFLDPQTKIPGAAPAITSISKAQLCLVYDCVCDVVYSRERFHGNEAVSAAYPSEV